MPRDQAGAQADAAARRDMQDSGAGGELRPASGVQGLQAVAGAAPHAQLNLVVVAAAAAAARAAAAFARATDVGRPPGRHWISAPQPHARATRRQGPGRAASRGRALQQRGGAAEAAAARPGAGEADVAAARPLVPKQAVSHLPQAARADQGEPRQQPGRRRQQPRPAAAAVWSRRRHPTAAAPRLDRRHDRRGDGGFEQHPHGRRLRRRWRLRRVSRPGQAGPARRGHGRRLWDAGLEPVGAERAERAAAQDQGEAARPREHPARPCVVLAAGRPAAGARRGHTVLANQAQAQGRCAHARPVAVARPKEKGARRRR
mmetsp:Transcript_19174/g.64612  ORF Transcript_19174/g.64612 Transcript_19174/m.64612 type:complete len:317 (+) Transcript_19174:705-1655(+)